MRYIKILESVNIFKLAPDPHNHPIDHPPINEFITFPPFREGMGGDPLIGCVWGRANN
jgi:hypothetical protein